MIQSKQQAMDLFEAKRKEFLELCRWIAVKICKKNGRVTIDDVRNEVKLPLGIDGRVFGAVFSGKEWVKTGYTQTKIKSSHNRPISIFINLNPL